VRVIVTVADSYGRPFPGLTQQQFSISEKKTPLDITYFDAEDKPVSVALIFDLSSSMELSSRKTSAQLAAQIIRSSNKASEFVLIGIRDTARVYCDLGCDAAEIATALQAIAAAETKEIGNTPLYDACDLALKKLQASRNEKQALIVFSDGRENSSKMTLVKLRDELRESSVIFYAIGLINPKDAGSSLSMEGGGILEELGTRTGGKAYFPIDAKELNQVADVIAMQLRSQYTIGFKRPDQTPDNKWHSIKIKLTLPKSEKAPAPHLRYRDSYYSH